MIKYTCYTTQHANFLIIKLDVEPVVDKNGNISHYRTIGRHSIPYGRHSIYLTSVKSYNAFDSYEEAEAYGMSIFNDVKNKILEKIKQTIDYQHKRYDKYENHKPKFKRINYK